MPILSCLQKKLAITFLCTSIGSVQAMESAFPVLSADSVIVEEIVFKAKMVQKLALSNQVDVCQTSVKLQSLIPSDWVTNYLKCRTQTKLGSKTIIWLSEERTVVNKLDTFRAIDLALELPAELKNGRLSLTNPNVRIFFTNCRHSWAHLTGCFVGVSAKGDIYYDAHDENSGVISLDLQLKSNEYLNSKGISKATNRQTTFRMTMRIGVGEDPFKLSDP